jgi:hypothetical protein
MVNMQRKKVLFQSWSDRLQGIGVSDFETDETKTLKYKNRSTQ